MTQKLGRFCLKTDVFYFLRLFFARCCSALLFKRFVPKIVPFSIVSFRKLLRFPAKPTRIVIARRARAPDAAIFDDAICHSETKYGCTERNRTLEWREGTRNDAANLMLFVMGLPFCFALPCFGAGCHTFGFKIATAALRPRNDTKLERFCLENRRFSFFAVVFCAVLLCIAFQTFRSENCTVFNRFVPEIASISRKTHQNCHCEEGAIFAPDAAIFDDAICHPETKYGCAGRNRTLE